MIVTHDLRTSSIAMRALTALALFAASATSALAARACTSTHADDAETEGCFGWCSFAAAEEHCSWCRCRGDTESTAFYCKQKV